MRNFELDLAVTEGLKRTAAEYAQRGGPMSVWSDPLEVARACVQGETLHPQSAVAVNVLAAWREMHVS